MIVEVAKSVDNEVGDGTTSAVVLAGSLIEKAEELVSNGHSGILKKFLQKSIRKIEFS
jgi:archaeal chaperonin